MTQEYTQHIIKIDTELKRWLPEEPDCAWAEKVFGDFGKKADMESIKLLLAPLRELLFRGGKRWRPLLMLLICEAFGGGDAALPLSPLVEFSHNASLIHDDIED
jgi:octaprenyl-diphosphate synthase